MLQEVVETMSMAKLNALHLHLSDTASFSLEIDEIPETKQASYTNKTYSRKDIQDLVQYAKIRGVRVIPEIDSPGHAP